MSKLHMPEAPETRVTDLIVPQSNSTRDLQVTGDIIARISSAPFGSRDRWTELYIVESDRGNFVGISVGKTTLPGESDIVNSSLSKNIDGLKEFFTVDGRRSGLSFALFDQVSGRLSPEVDRV